MRRRLTFDADLTDQAIVNIYGDTVVPSDGERLQHRITVDLAVTCRDQDGCDAEYVIECLELTNGNFIEEKDLSKRDRERLDKVCQEIADDAVPEAWQEYCEFMADAAHDRIKDGD